MDGRSTTVHALLRATRDGLARLNALLAERDPDDERVFSTRPREPDGTSDAERRIAAARKARTRT